MKILIKSLISFALLTVPFIANGTTQNNVNDALKIGVYVSPPYVIADKDGTYSGFAIDILMKAIQAAGMNKAVTFTEYSNIYLLLNDIDNIDIAVSDISFTPERLAKMDFSQPFDEGGLGVLVKNKTEIGEYSLVIYIYIAFGVLIAGLILTAFDRKYNPNFTRDWLLGYSESMFHVVSVITRGNSKHDPVSNKALQYWLSILWMISGSALLSFIMVSYMGLMRVEDNIESMDDLFLSTVAVQAGSTAEDYIIKTGGKYHKYDNIEEGLKLLMDDDVDAIVGDKSVLMYYENKKKGLPLKVLDNITLNKELYGYAYPQDSKLRKVIDEKILQFIMNDKIDKIKKYYGVDD